MINAVFLYMQKEKAFQRLQLFFLDDQKLTYDIKVSKVLIMSWTTNLGSALSDAVRLHQLHYIPMNFLASSKLDWDIYWIF